MRASLTVKRLRSNGVLLYLVGESLRFKAPRQLTPSEREAIARDREEIIRLIREEQRWGELAASGKTDLDVDDLDEALFLFAFRKIEEATVSDLPRIWAQYSPYWKHRIPKDAFRILDSASKSTTQTDQQTGFKNTPERTSPNRYEGIRDQIRVSADKVAGPRETHFRQSSLEEAITASKARSISNPPLGKIRTRRLSNANRERINNS